MKNTRKNKKKIKKTGKKWLIWVLAGVVVIGLVLGGVLLFGEKCAPSSGKADGPAQAPAGEPAATAYVEIEVKDVGVMQAELYGELAPITVENFLKLVDEGFYDGLTFHRIVYGFMIQGGDPSGNGTGGSKEAIKGEFEKNGVPNTLKHTRGVMSMARTRDLNSATSQFFIMHQDAPHLDGDYAAFGKVISGIEVVDALCANTPVTNSNGMVAEANQPVITAIRRIEKP